MYITGWSDVFGVIPSGSSKGAVTSAVIMKLNVWLIAVIGLIVCVGSSFQDELELDDLEGKVSSSKKLFIHAFLQLLFYIFANPVETDISRFLHRCSSTRRGWVIMLIFSEICFIIICNSNSVVTAFCNLKRSEVELKMPSLVRIL